MAVQTHHGAVCILEDLGKAVQLEPVGVDRDWPETDFARHLQEWNQLFAQGRFSSRDVECRRNLEELQQNRPQFFERLLRVFFFADYRTLAAPSAIGVATMRQMKDAHKRQNMIFAEDERAPEVYHPAPDDSSLGAVLAVEHGGLHVGVAFGYMVAILFDKGKVC